MLFPRSFEFKLVDNHLRGGCRNSDQKQEAESEEEFGQGIHGTAKFSLCAFGFKSQIRVLLRRICLFLIRATSYRGGAVRPVTARTAANRPLGSSVGHFCRPQDP